MRALVTGAAGFAGRHLVHLLRAEGHTVLSTGHGAEIDLDFRIAEVVEELLERGRPDVIFHLAGTSSVAEMARHPGAGEDNILTPAANVLRFARCRVLLVSTCHVYGRGATDEAAPLRPVDLYGAARASVEYLALDHVRKGGDVVIVRAFHHTGPGQDRRFALADWAARWREGERRIPVGNLEVRRDYADVRDIVAGYALLAGRGERGRAYNLCSGEARPMAELFRLLCPGAEPVVDPARVRPREPDAMSGSAAKAEALGWTRRYPIEQTLADLRADEAVRSD